MTIFAWHTDSQKKLNVVLRIFFSVILAFIWIGYLYVQPVGAGSLSSRKVVIGNPIPSAATTYDFSFNITSNSSVGSIVFEFCGNDPIPTEPCDPPAGFSASSANLISQSGEIGFSLHPSSNANKLILTRAPSATIPQSVEYVFSQITTPNLPGTSYVRLSTHSSTDGTGTPIDIGGIAYPINNTFNVSTEVPQYLEFCVGVTIAGFNCGNASGNSIDFGELIPTQTAQATSQFMAVTNAPSGYAVTVNGPTMTSGNNVIPTMNSTSQVGVSQYGLNLRANTTPIIGDEPQGPGTANPVGAYGNQNTFLYNSGDTIVTSNNGDDYRKFTVSYIVNVDKNQPAGDYSTTMYYICLANF